MGIRNDEGGIGGFTESLLAIMIVTVAVVLFTVTMSLNLAGLDDRDSLHDKRGTCQDLAERLMGDCSSIDGEALSESSLLQRAQRPYPIPEGTNGYLITVRDLGPESDILLELRQESNGGEGGSVSIRVPVCIKLQDGRTHAGLLEVSCW